MLVILYIISLVLLIKIKDVCKRNSSYKKKKQKELSAFGLSPLLPSETLKVNHKCIFCYPLQTKEESMTSINTCSVLHCAHILNFIN